jgi:predicted RNA-binding protein with EMAP domain
MKIFTKYLTLLLLVLGTHFFGMDPIVASWPTIMAVTQPSIQVQSTMPGEPRMATWSGGQARSLELCRVSNIPAQCIQLKATNAALNAQLSNLSLQNNQNILGQALSVQLPTQAIQGLAIETTLQQTPELLSLNNQLTAKTEIYVQKFYSEVGCHPNNPELSGLTLKQILHTTPQDFAQLSLNTQVERIALENNFLQQLVDIKKIENQIEIYKGEISQTRHVYTEKAEMLSVTQLKQEIPRLEARIESINSVVVESHNELELAKTRAQLDCAKDLLRQRMEQQTQLVHVQKFYGDIASGGQITVADQKLLTAIDISISDGGACRYEACNKLTLQAQQLLAQNKISPEKFELITGNALQIKLFAQTCTILDQTATLATAHKGNEVLKPYFEATTLSCSTAIDMIKIGTPQEAIAATKFACVLNQTMHVAVGIVKGVGEGIVTSVTSLAQVVVHPLQTIEDLKHAVYFLTSLPFDEKARAAILQSIDSFKQLPLEQQVQKITALITSMAIPVPTKFIKCADFQKALQAIAKASKVGLVSLKTIEKVETAALSIERAAVRVEQTAVTVEQAAQKVATLEQSVVVASHAVAVPQLATQKAATLEQIYAVARQAEQKVERNAQGLQGVFHGWDMPEKGKVIGGRHYTQHALERMAPDTIQVRAELGQRALSSYKDGGKLSFEQHVKDYIGPRNIPPSVVENAIQSSKKVLGKEIGTWQHEFDGIQVVVNDVGNVVTVRKCTGK